MSNETKTVKMENSKLNYGWNTKKENGLFTAIVYTIKSLSVANAEGYYAEFETIKTAAFPTRARAKAYAQKLVRYYKAQ